MNKKNNQQTLCILLAWLTGLFISAQTIFFLIHYTVSDLIDTLVNQSLSLAIFSPVVLAVITGFVLIQLFAYFLFVLFISFISLSVGEFFKLDARVTKCLAVLFCLTGCLAILTLNAYFYPNSFFAALLVEHPMLNNMIMLISCTILAVAALFAYIHYFYAKRFLFVGMFFLILVGTISVASIYEKLIFYTGLMRSPHKQPDIILIGLDSLRPDFTGFYGNRDIKTPTIDNFLQTSAAFSQAYTPLARTFPAWASILTGKYPKHNQVRINISDPGLITQHETLAKRMREAGYETIYGTDEPRFTDINEAYGFDHVIGPKSDIVEFFLGGLSDFPLTNLLINLPFGKYLFPYNYGNRAANITYAPNTFLQLVRNRLAERNDKPVFIALHLCLAHWPYTWATQHFSDDTGLSAQYRQSVQDVDVMLADLLKLFKEAGLLQNSLVVLLSDHGVALGMLNDRVIDKTNYLEDPKKLKLIKIYKLSSAPEYSVNFRKDYSISTSYGAGTDVLSLKQYHILLAFKRYGALHVDRQIAQPASLIDIAPTLLDFLKLQPLTNADGISLQPYFSASYKKIFPRPLFIETADTYGDLETDKIVVEKILKNVIGIYVIDANGRLKINPEALNSIIKAKQRAVLLDNWLYCRFPAESRFKLVRDKSNKNKMVLERYGIHEYYMLVNLKTGRWTVDMRSPLAQSAPLTLLRKQLKILYDDEVS